MYFPLFADTALVFSVKPNLQGGATIGYVLGTEMAERGSWLVRDVIHSHTWRFRTADTNVLAFMS